MSASTECIQTKHGKPCTYFSSNPHSVCGMVWYRTLRVNDSMSQNQNSLSRNNPVFTFDVMIFNKCLNTVSNLPEHSLDLYELKLTQTQSSTGLF